MFIRLEPAPGCFAGARHYEGICETEEDLTTELRNGYAEYDGAHVFMGIGSMILCLENDAVYVKNHYYGWTRIGGAEEEEES